MKHLSEEKSSWIIVSIETNQAIFETFKQAIALAINTKKYKAVPIGEYLGALNERIKSGRLS